MSIERWKSFEIISLYNSIVLFFVSLFDFWPRSVDDERLHFILTGNETWFYKPIILKVNPPFCNITACTTLPGCLEHAIIFLVSWFLLNVNVCFWLQELRFVQEFICWFENKQFFVFQKQTIWSWKNNRVTELNFLSSTFLLTLKTNICSRERNSFYSNVLLGVFWRNA